MPEEKGTMIRRWVILSILALLVVAVIGYFVLAHIALEFTKIQTIAEMSFPKAHARLKVRHVEPGALGADVLVVFFTNGQGQETALRQYPGDTHFLGFVAADSTKIALILTQADKQFQDTLTLHGVRSLF